MTAEVRALLRATHAPLQVVNACIEGQQSGPENGEGQTVPGSRWSKVGTWPEHSQPPPVQRGHVVPVVGHHVITEYRTTLPASDRDAFLPDELNNFYTCFKGQNRVAQWGVHSVHPTEWDPRRLKKTDRREAWSFSQRTFQRSEEAQEDPDRREARKFSLWQQRFSSK